LRAEREEQYKDHRLFKEYQDDLLSWMSRARDKVPALRHKNLGDKLAIESAVSALDVSLHSRKRFPKAI
jgi:nesprin-1